MISKDPVNGPPPTFHLLDVRETNEWNEDRIPFAVYTGRGCLERDIEQFVPDTYDEIVLYCASGARSLIAADTLRQMGYRNVASLTGGITEWKKSGKKVEGGAQLQGGSSGILTPNSAASPDQKSLVLTPSHDQKPPEEDAQGFPDSVVNHFPASSSETATALPSPDLENLLPTPPTFSGRESPANAEVIQSVLVHGTRMLKYPNKASSRPEERVIKVNLLPLQVSWESKKKKPTLSTVAPTKEECEIWVTGLHMLLAQADGNVVQTNMRTWLKRMWKDVDVTGRGKLDLDEVSVLMKRLNIRLSRVEIKSTFKHADISKQGFITYNNFERLYRALRFRPEIAELFSSLAKTNTPFLTYDEFEKFLVDTQKMTWTKIRCMEVYKKYCPADSDMMDLEHFSAFLISATNAIFRKTHTDVYQDMTRPLNEYFINSSHNTYLLGDQLTNAIEAISRYAFVSSPYPLILSFEIHCSIEQQNVMASILQELLGEWLLTKPLNEAETVLPSPEALKYKILLKAKRKFSDPQADESEYETEEEDFDFSWENNLQRYRAELRQHKA
ncbi:1-phosphatidylinositol 4,5-bisphosphate phosphodiesterase delta-4 [Phlyctochytrium bullatum]|nr:1-phosphatidylinositol 4,5-bisphosphate phosphodiesterase delta-4 [Phlyctochytrium bullatum]